MQGPKDNTADISYIPYVQPKRTSPWIGTLFLSMQRENQDTQEKRETDMRTFHHDLRHISFKKLEQTTLEETGKIPVLGTSFFLEYVSKQSSEVLVLKNQFSISFYLLPKDGSLGALQDAEAIENFAKGFKQQNVVVHAVNYFGVGDSSGMTMCKEDLMNAGIATVNYLLNQGVPSENISLHGHSLGGATAVLLAAHAKQYGHRFKFSTHMTFANMGEAAYSFVKAFFTKVPGLNSVLAWCAKKLFTLASWFTGFNLDPGKALKEDPELRKQGVFMNAQGDLDKIVGQGLVGYLQRKWKDVQAFFS